MKSKELLKKMYDYIMLDDEYMDKEEIEAVENDYNQVLQDLERKELLELAIKTLMRYNNTPKYYFHIFKMYKEEHGVEMPFEESHNWIDNHLTEEEFYALREVLCGEKNKKEQIEKENQKLRKTIEILKEKFELELLNGNELHFNFSNYDSREINDSGDEEIFHKLSNNETKLFEEVLDCEKNKN